MTKNVNYEITIIEILLLIKRKWKIIGLAVIIGVLLCGGYKALSDRTEQPENIPDDNYSLEMAYYDYYLSVQKDMPNALKEDWENVCNERLKNPVCSVNPYNCEYELIVLRFSEKDVNHESTIKSWISKADNEKLFGTNADILSDYKTSIMMVEKSNWPERSETAVQVISLDDYDSKAAADYLVKHFSQCAEEEQINIEGISKTSVKGYNETLNKYQQNNRNDFNAIYSAFSNNNNMVHYITQPASSEVSASERLKSIIKFCILGALLGFIVGVAIILFGLLRKRDVISVRQIEDTFNLELLSDCSTGNNSAVDVLNATLDVMTGKHSTIAVITDDALKGLELFSNSESGEKERTYLVCTDIFNNSEMIDSLKKSDGIVLGIELGKSKIEQIQRILSRSEKLNQRVLGFILL